MRKTRLVTLRKWFWALLMINLVFIIWSKNYLLPLSSGDIVRYETARTLANAQTIAAEWQLVPGKLTKAVQSINVDYLFILLYVSLLVAGCLYLARISRQQVLQKAGNVFAVLVIGAGVCDIIENVAMMESLTANMTGFNVRLAYDMAVAKFSVLILTLLFLAICFIFRLLNKAEERYESQGIYQ